MNKETWDEIQQTILLLASFGMWVMFEHWCYVNQGYAALPHTGCGATCADKPRDGFIHLHLYEKSTP